MPSTVTAVLSDTSTLMPVDIILFHLVMNMSSYAVHLFGLSPPPCIVPLRRGMAAVLPHAVFIISSPPMSNSDMMSIKSSGTPSLSSAISYPPIWSGESKACLLSSVPLSVSFLYMKQCSMVRVLTHLACSVPNPGLKPYWRLSMMLSSSQTVFISLN